MSCIWHSKTIFFGETFGVLNVGDSGPGGAWRSLIYLGPCHKNVFYSCPIVGYWNEQIGCMYLLGHCYHFCDYHKYRFCYQTGCIHLLGHAADHLPAILGTVAAVFAFQVFLRFFVDYLTKMLKHSRYWASVSPAVWVVPTGWMRGSITDRQLMC